MAIIVASSLQTTWLDIIRVEGVLPDLVLLVVIYFALVDGPERGMLTGAIGGVMQDIASDSVLGHYVLANTVVAYAAGRIASRMVTEHAAVKVALVFLGSLAQGVLFVLIQYVQQPRLSVFNALLGSVVPQAFYTALVTIVVFPVLDRFFRKEALLAGRD